jgi:hypothetical protein
MDLAFWLQVVGVIFLGLAAFKVPEKTPSWGWLGLFLIFIAGLLGGPRG